jgi:hydroxypyruvate reductase
MPLHEQRAHYRNALLEIYQAALRRVEGRGAVSNWLRHNPCPDRLRVIAIGKAAQSMAWGAHDVLDDKIEQALIISKQGHLDHAWCHRHGWVAHESAHPVPDESSLEAGQKLLQFIADDTQSPLLFLISGGTSSLVEVTIDGVGLDDLARVNHWLLGSGLDILQMNTVRKALSQIKGGGLLAYLTQSEVVGLAISDVPGDDPAAIGSGLLIQDEGLLERLRALTLPPWLREKLQRIDRQWVAAAKSQPKFEIVANLQLARKAAAEHAASLGYRVSLRGEFLRGDAAATGKALAQALLQGPPGIVIWGGETTVDLPPDPGQGGRNQHLALAAAQELAGASDCYLLAVGTDGSDGPTQDAGALVDGGTIARAALHGKSAERSLAHADSGHLLEVSGDLITTGPTGTNVMDLVIGLRV